MQAPVSQSRREHIERGIYVRLGTCPAVYEITWTENGRQHWRTIEGGLREARTARGDAIAKPTGGGEFALMVGREEARRSWKALGKKRRRTAANGGGG